MNKGIIGLCLCLFTQAAHAFPPTNTIVKCEFAFRDGSNELQWIEIDLTQGKAFIGSMPSFGNLKSWNPWEEQNLPRSTRISPAQTYYYFRMTTASGEQKAAAFPLGALVVHYRGLGIKHVPETVQKDICSSLEKWKKDWADKYKKDASNQVPEDTARKLADPQR